MTSNRPLARPDDTEITDPLAGIDIVGRSFVIEPLKILHVSVPKNACTSLRWLIAELAGESPDQFVPGLTPLINADDAIHRRRMFRHTPRLVDLDPEVRASIHPDNGWFVFAVLRDPRSRMFSAWQNKFLLHNPDFRNWSGARWYPAIPDSSEDIARAFARFVGKLHATPDHRLLRDGHFRSQTSLIRSDAVPYSRVYDVTELPALLTDLTAHLREHGADRVLQLRRTNDTPLRANAAMFAQPVRRRIEQLYKEDFENFGHLWDYQRIERVGDWPAAAVQDLRSRIQLHERIGDLVELGRAEADRAARLERRLARAQQRVEDAERRISDLEARPAVRAGNAARAVRRRLRRRVRRQLGRADEIATG